MLLNSIAIARVTFHGTPTFCPNLPGLSSINQTSGVTRQPGDSMPMLKPISRSCTPAIPRPLHFSDKSLPPTEEVAKDANTNYTLNLTKDC
jgi:hypothetical protein